MDCVTLLQVAFINMLFATRCCHAGAEKVDPNVADGGQNEKWTKFLSSIRAAQEQANTTAGSGKVNGMRGAEQTG